jgi:hypothetical protein
LLEGIAPGGGAPQNARAAQSITTSDPNPALTQRVQRALAATSHAVPLRIARIRNRHGPMLRLSR